MYMQRVSIYPRSDKVAEARTLLQERARARQTAGIRIALAELAAGAGGPLFTISILFDNLAAFEELRRRNQSDTDFQSFVAKLTSLERKPGEVELFEVVVPMPNP